MMTCVTAGKQDGKVWQGKDSVSTGNKGLEYGKKQ